MKSHIIYDIFLWLDEIVNIELYLFNFQRWLLAETSSEKETIVVQFCTKTITLGLHQKESTEGVFCQCVFSDQYCFIDLGDCGEKRRRRLGRRSSL